MPDPNLSPAAIEAYAVARANDPVIDTVEISHPTAGSKYLVNDKKDLTANLDAASGGALVIFRAMRLVIERPSQGETGATEVSITMDNVGREVSDYFNSIIGSQSETVLTARTYLSSDTTEPVETTPPSLTIEDVSMNVVSVTITARFVNVLSHRFPNEDYARTRFPGLR